VSKALVLAVFLALASLPGVARAHLMVDGNAQAGIDSWAFTANSAESNLLSWDAGVTNHVYQIYGYLGNATSVVRVIPTFFDAVVPIGGTGNTAMSQLSLNAAGAAELGLAAGDITLDYDFQIFETPRELIWDVGVINNSASTLDLVFYAYVDLDLETTWGNDVANGGVNGFDVADGFSGFDLFVGASIPADHYAIAAYSGLQATLDAMQGVGASNLSDTGSPFGPADFTGALQFDLQIASGGSQGIGVTLIPEPATLIQLGLGLFGLAVAGRRRA
jgi:hypothetical protein